MSADWRVGDQTGSYDDQVNDVAVPRPPGRAPLLIAAFREAPEGGHGHDAQVVLREVGRVVANTLRRG